MNVFYAKSNGETLEEHTNKVLGAFEKLEPFLKLNEKEKFIIEKLIEFHDSGKRNPEFQNRMRKILGIFERFRWNNGNIPHEWLSPAFITQQEEEMIKTKLRELQLDEERFFKFFIFTILSHHHRENIIPDNDLINTILNWIKDNWNFEVEYHYDVNDILDTYNIAEDRARWNTFFHYRAKWLGSLMKCDYCASAGIDPEEGYNGNYQNDLQEFINKKQIKLRDFQITARKNSDKSIILVASTGIGKTEAAMNWINGQKAFYLLGIRIAVNEMHKRFKNIFGNNVNLLHGETSYFFAQTETNEDEYEDKIEKTRKLSYPLTVATADQLVTSVFKYPGFEFTYLTCTYSKIVLDEIQSFSPASIAAIVVFLKEIHNLGGRFMLMTATLPPFIVKEFRNFDNIHIFEPQLLNIKRHKIAIVGENIESDKTKELLWKNQDKKILIICNTVRKAQALYDFLKEFSPRLIHAQFIGKDRKKKEKDIMEASASCVWIATQIVEASLDIDFDILLTENASIESLLQRFGRCYRNREYLMEEANIYIFASTPSNIYDKDLFNASWAVLQSYNNRFLSEEDKQNMIDQIFRNAEQTNYYNEYRRLKDLLEIGYRSLSRVEAQEDFRQITNNYIVIPEDVYKNNYTAINSLLNFIEDTSNDKLERVRKQAELMDYTIPIELGLTGKAIESEEAYEPDNII